MDWDTVVILAAITLLDGVRRVPPGTLVLRRALGQWSVDDRESERGFRLVAWWNPITLALIIPSRGVPDVDAAGDQTDDALAARLSSARRVVGVLRALGALVLVAIVFGIPAAVERFDAWGFALSLTVVMLLSFAIAIIVSFAMRRSGRGWRRAIRIAAPLLYPFTAPRGAELVLDHAIAGAAPLVVARRLLGAPRFAEWVRPRAYDAIQGATLAHDPRGLAALVGASGLAQIVRTPPANCEAGERYCARCARVYRASTAACAECEGLPLIAHPAG